MLRYLKIAKWRANKHLKRHNAHLEPHRALIIKRVQSVWFNLSTAQKLYLLALISLIVLQMSVLASCLTVVAFIVEFWPKFIQMWHSLAGKALILLFYATIANFVLASASGIVNEVTLVSATYFNYTHNFATLLYLPPWALGITLATLLLLQLLLPFYIIALLLIKPFGSDRIKFITQSYSPLLTAFLRFFLASVVIVNLVSFINDKPAERVLDDLIINLTNGKEIGKAIAKESSEEKLEAVEKLTEKLEKPLSSENPKTSASNKKTIRNTIKVADPTTENLRHFLDTKGYFERSKWLIAMFAYNFEADSYSRCAKSKGSKAVELNDYEFVEIKPDNEKPYGYNFTVKACDSPGIKPSR